MPAMSKYPRLTPAVIACTLAATPVWADQTVDEAIGLGELESHVEWFAADERTGRGLFGDGLDASADYIVDQFERLGLKSFTAENFEGYFHVFELPAGAELDDSQTSLTAGDLELVTGDDYVPFGWSTPGAFEGPLVFAGYGIQSPANDYDDYADVDAEGKIALVLRYEPADAEGNSLFTGAQRMSAGAQFRLKAAAAARNGAKALLIVDPYDDRGSDRLNDLGTLRPITDLPAMHISRDAAKRLAESAGIDDLDTLQEQIDTTGKPASREGDDTLVSGGWDADSSMGRVQNVVAYLPGENENEYVVVGAHYDHLGDPRGVIHNGADDNASGTAAVLEIAEAMAVRAQNGEKPARTVIFALFSAEEVGLIGSTRLVADFPVPTEDVVGMVNLDMIGRLRDDQLFVGGMRTAPGLSDLVNVAMEGEGLERVVMSSDFDGRSDHAPFIRSGIPAIFLHTGLHPQYHRPDDDTPTVNFEGLVTVTEVGERLLTAMAESPREPLAFATPRQPVRLGISIAGEVQGVIVGNIAPGSPAADAGLEVGDVIRSIGGEPVTDVDSLRAALGNLSQGDRVQVLVFRDGADRTLDVTFGEPATP
jgi:hypothetical protein